MEEIRDDIRDKLHFFADRNLAIHLILKPNYSLTNLRIRSFRNGKIIKFNSESIEFIDEKLGEILIFFSEILGVEKREERR